MKNAAFWHQYHAWKVILSQTATCSPVSGMKYGVNL
jgi:hypothetical protein